MPVSDCLAIFERLLRTLSRRKSKTVGASADRNLARATAEAWIRTYRPAIVETLGVTEAVIIVDRAMQDILALSFAASERTAYREATSRAIAAMRGLAVQVTIAEWSGQRVGEDSAADAEAERRLEGLGPALADSYRQVLADVEDPRRITWKGTANELREVLREVLDILAPDAAVRQREWFRRARAQATSSQDRDRGPTQAERVRFILESRAMADAEVTTAQEAVMEIEGGAGRVARAVYTRASAATHVERGRQEIMAVIRYMRAVLLEVLPAPSQPP